MDYSRFYTPPAIADLLIKQLNIKEPASVIDICCGSCNLLFAAKKRWDNINLFGVDIIKHCLPGVNFKVSDGRKYAIKNKYQYSLILANPPFDFVRKKREYEKLFFELKCNKFEYETSRLENEMLLANLMLLNDDGILLIIMPSTFIESEKNESMRKYLARHYYVHKIIKLPKETFGPAKIKAYALILRKTKNIKKSTSIFHVQYLDRKFYISKVSKLSHEIIRKGIWYQEGFNFFKNSNYDIKRGNISSQMFSNNGIPVLHTAKLQDNWVPSIRYIINKPQGYIYAEAGDIVISRIGKSAGQWCVHNGQKIIISDCLYRLKDPDNIIAKNIQGKKYDFLIKGVATQYITSNDFINWYQSLVN